MSRPDQVPAPEPPLRDGIDDLLARISRCRICRDTPSGPPLPHEPRPVLQYGEGAGRLLICGQAPGTRVHESGRPFTDRSGERLRDWLGVSESVFYDPDRVAVVPMGFCFPGQNARGADLPPRRECAATWHPLLFKGQARPRLTVLLGLYAAKWHLKRLGRPDLAANGLEALVTDWAIVHAQTGAVVLPHPSWRTVAWTSRRPWFDRDLIPALRAFVADAVGTSATSAECERPNRSA